MQRQTTQALLVKTIWRTNQSASVKKTSSVSKESAFICRYLFTEVTCPPHCLLYVIAGLVVSEASEREERKHCFSYSAYPYYESMTEVLNQIWFNTVSSEVSDGLWKPASLKFRTQAIKPFHKMKEWTTAPWQKEKNKQTRICLFEANVTEMVLGAWWLSDKIYRFCFVLVFQAPHEL